MTSITWAVSEVQTLKRGFQKKNNFGRTKKLKNVHKNFFKNEIQQIMKNITSKKITIFMYSNVYLYLGKLLQDEP